MSLDFKSIFKIADQVLVKIEGATTGPDGVLVPFDFALQCTRDAPAAGHDPLAEAMQAFLQQQPGATERAVALMAERVTNWHIKDATGASVPFDRAALADLFTVLPGMLLRVYRGYAAASSVQEKN